MSKEYPDQLGAWTKRHSTSRRDRNLAAFLAVAADVRTALGAGYQIKTIWANLSESQRIAFGYDAFLRYVHRLILDPDTAAACAEDQTQMATTAPSSRRTNHTGFTFNPVPNKEELL